MRDNKLRIGLTDPQEDKMVNIFVKISTRFTDIPHVIEGLINKSPIKSRPYPLP